MQRVDCNQCSKSFGVKVKEKKHGKGIKENYFTCPHCKHWYTAAVTDAECRRLQTRIGRMQDKYLALAEELAYERITKTGFNHKSKLLQEKEQQLKDSLSEKMSRLRGMVSK